MHIKYAVLATLLVKDAHRENGVRLERMVNVLCTSLPDAKKTYYEKCGRYEVAVEEVKTFHLVETSVKIGCVNEDDFFCSDTVNAPLVSVVPDNIMAMKVGDTYKYLIPYDTDQDETEEVSTLKLTVCREPDSPESDEADEVRNFTISKGISKIGEVQMVISTPPTSKVSKLSFGAYAYNAEMGADGIDNFKDAVECVVDSWEENK